MENKLDRKDLMSMAIGQIIGVGIMTMTGIAIGFTGRSVNLAFIIAGIITLITSIPQIYIGGTANFTGGQYSQIGILSGKTLAGIYTFINLSLIFGVSMYTISFTEYLTSLIPAANPKLAGFVVLSVICLMHLVGVKQAARLQNVMVVILAVAMGAYVVMGLGKVSPTYFQEDFFTNGLTGFALASVFLTFASGGATYIVNYSSEAKNPTKDIPFVIIASTSGIIILYVLMSTIAAGVLPVAEVANQPLSVSAAVFMPKAIYTFFVVGGAMFSLLTTLNFSIGMMVYPALKACEDGWLPKKLGQTNKKFGTAHWIILIIYLVGILPILFNIDLSTVANSTVILTTSIRIAIGFSAMQLPKKLPELWENSDFYVSDSKLKAISIISILISLVSITLLFVTSSKTEIIGNFAILAIAVILTMVRKNKVKMSIGYENK